MSVRCDEYGRGFFFNENLTGMVAYSERTNRFIWSGRTFRAGGEVYGMAKYSVENGAVRIVMADGPVPSMQSLLRAAEELIATLSNQG
jgi:hypothetical protein